MRISDTQFSQMMLQSLQSNNAGLGHVLQQMSTGDRLTKLSDDPMASIKLLNLDRENSAISQYANNIANVKTTLSNQEVHLDSVSESLKSIRDLVLWGANGTLSDDDRSGMIVEIEHLRDSIVSSFNAQDEEGHYLFSGTKSGQAAVVKDDDGNYVVQGNAEKRIVTVAKGVTMESNMTAKDLLNFGGEDSSNNILNQLNSLLEEFKNPTANFQDEVANTLNSIDDTLGSTLGALTELGGRQNNLSLMDDAHSENKLFVDKVTSDLSALDYAEASVRLSNFMTALQATQASYVKINDLNLFDRI